MKNRECISPVTGEFGTRLLMRLAAKEIINSYMNHRIDVARYLNTIHDIEIRQCEKTGYRYYYPFNIFGDDVFYEILQKGQDHYYPTNKWEHRTAIKYISKNANVLEIGCGTGYFLKMIKLKGANAVGLELNSQEINEAKNNSLNVYKEGLEEHSINHSAFYDVVCSFQVLEHLSDVKGYFDAVKRCLKPGGRIIIGVPNSNPFMYKHDVYHTLNLPPHHAGLWNKKSLENIASHFGLKIILIKHEFLKDYKQWYLAQIAHYELGRPRIGRLLKGIPRPIFKFGVRVISPWLEGRNILAILDMPERILDSKGLTSS